MFTKNDDFELIVTVFVSLPAFTWEESPNIFWKVETRPPTPKPVKTIGLYIMIFCTHFVYKIVFFVLYIFCIYFIYKLNTLTSKYTGEAEILIILLPTALDTFLATEIQKLIGAGHENIDDPTPGCLNALLQFSEV